MTDSISAAEERSLRAQLNALERKQDARFARRETFLNERDRTLAAQACELEATIKDYREQLAAAQAELAKLDDTEVPAEPQGQRQIGPEEVAQAEAIQAAAAGLGSKEHMAWRRQHIASSQGLFR
jgi:uncharacterized protein involved in exopolysaccharide biosynthesis